MKSFGVESARGNNMSHFKSIEALKDSLKNVDDYLSYDETLQLVSKAYTLGFQDGKASCSSAAYGTAEDVT